MLKFHDAPKEVVSRMGMRFSKHKLSQIPRRLHLDINQVWVGPPPYDLWQGLN